MSEEAKTTPPMMTPAQFHETFHKVRTELARVVVGQDRVVEHLLVAMFAGGHVLLTGLPGLGRTLLVKTLAQVLGLQYRRLQFTPDLLPTDIIGAEILESSVSTGERNFRFFKGPVFANLVLVDEINRSPARTQSALLEVMQERQVTAGGTTYFLPKPFTLIATENTLETEGVWPLGEAQTDRFMMSIEQEYPREAEERRMIVQTTGTQVAEVSEVAGPEIVQAMQRLAREVPVVPSVRDFALAIVRASRPGEVEAAETVNDVVRLGASPRAAQALLLGGKVTALARGRTHVTRQDIISVVRPVMNHRVLMDFRALAEGHTKVELIGRLIDRAKERTVPRLSRWTEQLLYPVAKSAKA
ncbi:MAG: MoxR family ATPase [Phycisphaerae bacterium]|nr:MoxR family ATPase [Phycisphaerae bacterium]